MQGKRYTKVSLEEDRDRARRQRSLMDWTGKPCPKCAYVRAPADTNPAWQCPNCQIAYAKFQAGAPIAVRFAEEGREMVGRAASDVSILPLLAANAIALAMALALKMDLR